MNHSNTLAIVCAFTLAACGGGGSAGAPSSSAPSGESPPPSTSTVITSMGVITGFGSIVVNGARHAIDSDTIVAIEGENEITGDDSRLRLGMRVSIDATENNGTRTAQRIEYDEDLKGPVQVVTPKLDNPAIGTITIVDQLVIVDSNTIFDDDVGNNDGIAGIDIRDLAPTNFTTPVVVEVSGFPTETGVLATRIDRVNASIDDLGRPDVSDDELEIKGFVDSITTDLTQLSINGSTFFIGDAMFDDGLVAGPELVGELLEVKADVDSSGRLIAVLIEREDELNEASDNEFEIEGILQSVDTLSEPNRIVINGHRIEIDDASSLTSQVGQRIEIKGVFSATGAAVIRQTRMDAENSVRVQDRISGIASDTGRFSTRLGLEVMPTTNSRVEDDLGEDGDHLSPDAFISRLTLNDFIEARGFLDGGTIVWSRVTREDEDEPDCRLRGPVDADSIADPRFAILGVIVDTSSLDNDEFEDAAGVSIGRAAFFDRLQSGDVVEAQSDDTGSGCQQGMLLTGNDGEVSFEPDDGVAGNDPSVGGSSSANDNEVVGPVRNLDSINATFRIGDQSISVNADTMIDASIVERARAAELGDASIRLGDLPESLDQLVRDGDLVRVRVDQSGTALEIEDI